MNPTLYNVFDSPIGPITLCSDGVSLTGLYLPQHRHWNGVNPQWHMNESAFQETKRQLAEYFAGRRKVFDIPLRFQGTPFQLRVWEALQQIPFGTTISYADLASRVGQPNASRAVGNANGRNPLSIVVPCHRVVGAGGRLTGYAGGVDRKQWLLSFESQSVQRS